MAGPVSRVERGGGGWVRSPSNGGRKVGQATPKVRPTATLPADRLNGSYSDIVPPKMKAEIKPGRNDISMIELAN
jgi:hypothetical protein